jgi:molybdenum cofactor synthesis domain-containing protein
MTAALLIVGSEVLSGSVTDANTPWLARSLTARGVDLARVCVVPDDTADIAATARDLRARHPCVFVAGGIGPTADDVTYEAIARAFDLELALHEPTVARMRPHYASRGVELNDARLRMATLPLYRRGKQGGAATPELVPPPEAEVLFTEGLWVPLVKVAGTAEFGPVVDAPPASSSSASSGVYVLPGIPRLFQAMFSAHADSRFRGPLAETVDLFSSAGEGDVADPLRRVAEQFPSVAVGSYVDVSDLAGGLPSLLGGAGGGSGARARVRLSFTSRDAEALRAAVEAARGVVPGLCEAPPPSAGA